MNCIYFRSAILARRRAYYGEGRGLIGFVDLKCTGEETSILGCPHVNHETIDCFHWEDAGVDCNAGNPTFY